MNDFLSNGEQARNIQDLISQCHLYDHNNPNLKNLLYDLAISFERFSKKRVKDKDQIDKRVYVDWKGKEIKLGANKNLRQFAEDICRDLVLNVFDQVGKVQHTAAMCGCSATTVHKYIKQAEGHTE